MSPTILIIDDCTDIARIIARYLETAGCRTMIAGSGVEAQGLLACTTPDCIVLDLMMPGMSGAEFLHALRSNPASSDIPVVLVSARVGHHGTHFRSQMDANYSVGKPFTRQQIVHAVRTVLARREDVVLPAMPPVRTAPIDAKARLAAQLGIR